MHVAVESPQPGITVIRPTGTLDMNSVPRFRSLLETQVQHARRGLILVLDEVQFMDSSGVAALIEGFKWSRARTLPYILTDLPAAVKMVLELARLENFFTIVANLDEAIALITHASAT
jgi:anti-sigma B factor antagonist